MAKFLTDFDWFLGQKSRELETFRVNVENSLICHFQDFWSNKGKFPYLEFPYLEYPLYQEMTPKMVPKETIRGHHNLTFFRANLTKIFTLGLFFGKIATS